MAVYPTSVYELNGDDWLKIAVSKKNLPISGPPPRKYGDTILFRDEGRYESEKRLWRLELSGKRRLLSLEEESDIDAPADSFSYCVTPDGALWASLGDGVKTIIRRSPDGKFRIAITDNSLKANDDRDAGDGIGISALATRSDGSILGVGNTGIYVINGKVITSLVQLDYTSQEFLTNQGKNTYHWDWDPSDVLELDDRSMVVSGVYGGIYRIDRDENGRYHIVALDEKMGKPIRL
jgi:hypothetical protein